MRTSLNNIKTIEEYLEEKISPGEGLLFEAKTLLNSELATDVQHQEKSYAIIRQYSRQKLKQEIIAIQKMFVTAPENRDYLHRVTRLFKKC